MWLKRYATRKPGVPPVNGNDTATNLVVLRRGSPCNQQISRQFLPSPLPAAESYGCCVDSKGYNMSTVCWTF